MGTAIRPRFGSMIDAIAAGGGGLHCTTPQEP
ncbi:agmatine deiminase family protein [Spirulina major]|nr:agmatine deiminase family protein [Spirulina major]